MVTANPYQQYQQNVINTSTPQELTLMLYNGLVKFLKLGIEAIEENNPQSAHNNIIKAQNIIEEFMSTLNMDYDISKNLYSIYEYMNWQLVNANIKKDKAAIEEVVVFAEDLRNTWSQAMKLAKNRQTVNK
ncbi:Flagellar secretion chaperone FliS [bioreactor metagenome]|mgnify:FL=1|uniref:Flagellar secretion chaperone FliS n=2 Tax=root TaxID=1 RepID=A0ABT1NBK4_9FIRM|nr:MULTISPECIES: flagellar export chaperone FliS [Lutispora]MCQ1528620.1 flagellar export chaperone FliS [Lutispora saccharofermentans]MEA4963337.1 flagellar export chaperone FliS [Lutispora sp.]